MLRAFTELPDKLKMNLYQDNYIGKMRIGPSREIPIHNKLN
jgi:hypothetical protein